MAEGCAFYSEVRVLPNPGGRWIALSHRHAMHAPRFNRFIEALL